MSEGKQMIEVADSLAVMDSRRARRPMGMISAALQIAALQGLMEPEREGPPITQALGGRPYFHNGVRAKWHPWDTTHLSKAERKGKTADEIQTMRRQKYEASNPPASGIRHLNRRYIMGFKEILADIKATIKEGEDIIIAEGHAIESAALIKIKAAKLALAESGVHLTEMAEAGLHELDARTLLFLEDAFASLATEEKAIIAKLQSVPQETPAAAPAPEPVPETQPAGTAEEPGSEAPAVQTAPEPAPEEA